MEEAMTYRQLLASAALGVVCLAAAGCGAGEPGNGGAVEADIAQSIRQEEGGTRFLGLRTVVYHVMDLASAKDWYSRVLGFGPYFDEAFYVGFDVGGFELGLLPAESGSPAGLGGTTAYWGVENAEEALAKLLEHGATLHEDVEDVGEGIKVASVIDPFGNQLAVIENPHFKL
jgi:predicted enzyme related to lactoylglutathione lyase